MANCTIASYGTALAVLILAGSISAQPCCPSFAIVDIDTCRQRITLDRPIGWTIASGETFMLHVSQSRYNEADSLLGRAYWCTVDTVIRNQIFCRSSGPAVSCTDYVLQVVVPQTKQKLIQTDTLRPRPWNGRFGGIVAIWHPGTFSLRTSIDASHVGFRGGKSVIATSDTASNTYSLREMACGEGEFLSKMRSHRGGSPGYARNGGGGGGASYGSAGNGGNTCTAFDALGFGGAGGQANNVDSRECVFGGSGGAGHRNNAGSSNGGNGGGMIVICCDTVLMDSTISLSATGAAGDISKWDGAGGGGAGGVVSIHGQVLGSGARIDVSGGRGGDAFGSLFEYGPGGGGTGGRILFSQTVVGTLSCKTPGGPSGSSRRQHDTIGNARQAAAGDSGGVIIASTQTVLPVSLVPSVFIACRDSIVEVDSTTILTVRGSSRCVWANPYLDVLNFSGDSVRTPPVREPTWFVVTITTKKGCTVIDSILIRPKIEANTLTVEADMVRAAPGDSIDLFLRFTSSNVLTTPMAGVAYLSTRASVAHPLDVFAHDSTHVTARVPFTMAFGATQTFRRIKYSVTLGDSTSCIVSIDSVILSGGPMTIRRRHGRITLDSICTSGNRPRLFDPSTLMLSIQGRHISARADDLWIIDPIGRSASFRAVRSGSEVHAYLSDNVRGIIYIVMICDGIPITRTLWVED